ncbi:MAG TPA: glycosyltransferase family 4 protein, partial [Dehalococcoidia bacterium]|nr:glycosyltransferase family 4 protein [Dehalococcoidia bacterium]
ALIALGANPDRTSLLPNVPDPGLLERSGLSFDDAPPDVLYIGTLSWQPNAQGMQSFLREAMPKFADKLPGSRLMVAGSGPPSWLRDWAGRTPFLELVSPVLDVEALYRRARVFLEPVSGGGGTKLKVLNALARGLPVVTTPDGADGIAAIDGEHLLIGRDGDELLDRLSRVTQDRELWERLSKNGRELIRERYVPDIAYEPVAELLAKAT